MNRLLAALLAALFMVGPALAQDVAAPDQPLADPQAEARAQRLFADIRCVVCQHESIADSPAGLAGDLRRLVRERIAEGATDEQIEAELVARYGDFILFRPPFNALTALLWGAPFALGLGGLAVFLAWSRRRRSPVAPLTAEEERALRDRLGDDAH
jgi:cytochrome c-type biogenesis protein CcmH